MSAVIFLDAAPLGVLVNPQKTAATLAARRWLTSIRNANRRVIVPEITDYEVRRELLRAGSRRGPMLLDQLAQQLEYLPLTTSAMRLAAELWAQARAHGYPTAADPALDADVILAAQAHTFGVARYVVATSNVAHLSRFVPAMLWQNITP